MDITTEHATAGSVSAQFYESGGTAIDPVVPKFTFLRAEYWNDVSTRE